MHLLHRPLVDMCAALFYVRIHMISANVYPYISSLHVGLPASSYPYHASALHPCYKEDIVLTMIRWTVLYSIPFRSFVSHSAKRSHKDGRFLHVTGGWRGVILLAFLSTLLLLCQKGSFFSSKLPCFSLLCLRVFAAHWILWWTWRIPSGFSFLHLHYLPSVMPSTFDCM